MENFTKNFDAVVTPFGCILTPLQKLLNISNQTDLIRRTRELGSWGTRVDQWAGEGETQMHHGSFKPSIKVTFGDDDYGDVDITIKYFYL